MGDKKNFAALDWVIGEIADTLNDARSALEAYVEDPKDSTKMRFCLTHIHQVYGSLQMVEFHGASLLAEEMEHLAQSIINNKVSSGPEAHEVLMRSMLQLPIYLDRVKNQKEDNPAVILPLLNDLRAVRKQSYLSETNLFSPDLTPLTRVHGSKHAIIQDPKKLKEVLKKLREMYQFSAASVLRDVKPRENLDYIEKVFSRLLLLTGGTASFALWEASAALMEGLRNDDIQLSVAVRGLLRYLARELRLLGENAPGALNMQPPESLLKNVLYYVARANEGSDKIKRVKEKYNLGEALLCAGESAGKDDMSVPDPVAIRSVVVALQAEINSIKHVLDLSLAGQSPPAELKEVLPVIKRVADTLAVLGIGDLRKQVLMQAEVLESLSKQNEIDGDQLIDVANRVIEFENRLSAIAKVAGTNQDLNNLDERTVEIDQAKRTVLKECQRGLEQTKDAIVEYISSKWDKTHLENIDRLLTDIRGGLDMVPLPRPGKILDSCNAYINENLLAGGSPPDWSALDALADAITSVEYYLERLIDDIDENLEPLLDIAEESVSSLGYAVAPTIETPANQENIEQGQQSVAPQFADNEDTVAALQEPAIDELASSNDSLETLDDVAADTDVLAHQPDNNFAEPSTGQVENDAESNAVPATEAPQQNDEEPAAVASVDEEESDIDDEIIEIFIEEAGEVCETLAEYFPKWKANNADNDSLIVVRRAFHTLKGSGRMVEAVDLGELAWSVENMLNRVIDNTVQTQPAHSQLITLVLQLIPELIEAFKNKKRNPKPELTEQYMAWGSALSDGHIPDELLQESTSESVPSSTVEDTSELQEPVEEENEDHVLWDIFSSEAQSHLGVMEEFIEQMQESAPIYSPPSDSLQRAMHTLKGSARMAQVMAIADLVEPLEAFAKELISYQVNINSDILQLLKDAVEYTRLGLDDVALRREVKIPKLDQFLARAAELQELSVGHLIRLHESKKQGSNEVDPQLLSIFMAEEMKMLLDADELLQAWQRDGIQSVNLPGLVKELSLLEIGADRAKLPEMVALVNALRINHENALAGKIFPEQNFFTAVARGHESLLDLVDAIAAGQNIMAPPDDVMPGLLALLPTESAQDDEYDIDGHGAELHIDAGTQDFETFESFEDEEALTSDEFILVDEMDEAAAPDMVFENSEDSHSGRDESLTTLNDLPSDENIDTNYGVELVEENISSVHQVEQIDIDVPDESALNEPEAEQELDELPDTLDVVEEIQAAPESLEAAPTAQQIPGLLDVIDVNDEDFDEDILEVFVEEAEELIEELDEAVHAWENNWSDLESVEAIKRALHTLKGGARLAGMNNLGQLTHEYESYLIGMDITDIDGAFFTKIHSYQDRVLVAVRGIQSFMGGGAELVAPVIEAPQPSSTPPPTEIVVEELPTADEKKPDADATNVLPFATKPKEEKPLPVVGGDDGDSEFIMPAASAGGATATAAAPVAARKAGPQEVIKVSAELLEELVNLAGETSISRGRLEQQVTDFGSALEEIDGTIERLQEQLRRLDIETEAQVLFRQEQIEESQKDFDPLEMDRYSALQQLSRSLIESASDLVDLKSTLADKVRDTETLLLQQSRVNSTLQEGLMRSRMVPFARLVPRLRRIVRQVAAELGKQVSFELDNVEGELDRSVLERMVAPLEHMLRNAVDHGIEKPNDRVASGKPESGRIVLTLGREGGDVLLRLADDGCGINLKRVREKAIERGLMTAEANLSDHDIMQFILHAGFSTAENVTQISGRGVGMDVVYSEIKQLGGTVSINSAWGKGTEFFVRLPFTVSVNRALMIEIHGDNYAVPLNTIGGIVRVSPFELEHYYSDPEARFEYAGESYEMRYMGTMLNDDIRPRLEGKSMPLPVLLVRSAENTMALQVDSLLGSREIVVKSLGVQFSTVQGLSGATVMGDGSVVVILDPHALVRKEVALSSAKAMLLGGGSSEVKAEPEHEEEVITVMVVDDSVTVRKVTTRFLEREGFEVITAKDGVHALEVLQETIPDIMLLDIEMPRMDGFEVAKNVRNTSRWKKIPIIMITSRTGDKHRDHALSLGVNKYLGKPYQEDLLLESINELLAESVIRQD